jgi:hypothetical protein
MAFWSEAAQLYIQGCDNDAVISALMCYCTKYSLDNDKAGAHQLPIAEGGSVAVQLTVVIHSSLALSSNSWIFLFFGSLGSAC